ncbi:uncharacterized protein LOC110822950 [Carica papaya]|uniref:uncharacterized protein LOC110822950 n=1 Tax=Carica papaya TaxID=3649 RepID=UPI000B8C80DE|nr:uncharacterized protein LOC110822950 [Carica papaya]
MDPITFQKIQTIKKSKKHQLADSFVVYTFTAVITCSVFMCCNPFWFSSLCSSFKLFILNGLPKFGSVLLGTKVLFVMGNLIVVVLLAESKSFSSSPPCLGANACYDEFVEITESCLKRSDHQMGMEKVVVEEIVKIREIDKGILRGEEDDQANNLTTEELNKRANDLIARVNRRRRVEARLLLGCNGEY